MSVPEKEEGAGLDHEEQAFFGGGGAGPEPGSGPEATEADPMGIGRRAAERELHRLRQQVWVLALFLVLSGVLVFLLRGELGYFFASGEPLALGPAEDLAPGPLPDGAFVSLSGVARDMCIRAEVVSGRMRYLYLLGSEAGARLLVQSPAVPGEGCAGAVERSFAGRLRDLGQTDMYAAVLQYYRENFPAAPRAGPMYLLEDGVRPRDRWAYPAAVAGLLLVAAVNAALVARRMARRGRARDGDGEGEGEESR
jgi:hypothetical protein